MSPRKARFSRSSARPAQKATVTVKPGPKLSRANFAERWEASTVVFQLLTADTATVVQQLEGGWLANSCFHPPIPETVSDNNNNNGYLQSAHIYHDWYSWCYAIITPAYWAYEAIHMPSQLPGEYTAPAAVFSAQELNQPQQPSLPSQVPIYTPGWREASGSKVTCPRSQVASSWIRTNDTLMVAHKP